MSETMGASLDELEALLAKATEGPWYHAQTYDDKGALFKRWIATDIGPFNNVTEFVHSPWDAELIVAAVNWCRTERPALIAERDALREALAWYANPENYRTFHDEGGDESIPCIPCDLTQADNEGVCLSIYDCGDRASAALGAHHDAK